MGSTHHWKVSQRDSEGIVRGVSWFDDDVQAYEWSRRVDGEVAEVSCAEYEATWHDSLQWPHDHSESAEAEPELIRETMQRVFGLTEHQRSELCYLLIGRMFVLNHAGLRLDLATVENPKPIKTVTR